MIAQLIFLTTFLAIANAGLLLSGGLGYGGYGLGYGGLGYGGIGLSAPLVAKQPLVDYYTPPKYEYKYAVEDGYTGDLKEQTESRVGDLTKSEYALAEKDRSTRVSRIIAGAVPLVGKGYY